MCGIVGLIIKGNSGFIKQTEDSFLELLYVDAVRGQDSTGVIAVEKDGGFSIVKEASASADFLPMLKNTQVHKDMWNGAKAYIGHNRKKTVGKIEDASAHPFVVDDTFAMVHNGTLHCHKNLGDTETDSEALAQVFKKAFDEEEWKPALEAVLGDVWGAYATVMYDQKREVVRFLRNKDRPLYLVEADNALFFASEGMMATWVLTRNNYAYKDLKIELLPEHTLVTYDLVNNKMSQEVLTPTKKYTPVTKVPTTMTGKGGGKGLGGTVSKQEFKFFKKKWIGRRISFWIDDYIEKNFPKTVDEDGETELMLFASCDDIPKAHSIAAEVDIAHCAFTTSEELFEQRWNGVIGNLTLNEATGCVLVDIEHCKPVLMSRAGVPYVGPVKDDTTDIETLNEKLSELSLAVLETQLVFLRSRLNAWEIECYEAAIRLRKKETDALLQKYHKLGYDACFEEAEKEGVKLKEVFDVKNGKRKLIHPTKGMVYESPVVVH